MGRLWVYFDDRWDVGIKGQEEATMTTRFVASAQGRVVTLQEPKDTAGRAGLGRRAGEDQCHKANFFGFIEIKMIPK